MIIKKFQAPTETEAVLKAKEDMGSNAVVVNIKTIKPRGIMSLFKKMTVEVTAALEEKAVVENSPKNESVVQKEERAFINSEREMVEAIDKIRIREEQKNEKLEEKIDTLQTLLEQNLNRTKQEEVDSEEVKREEAPKKVAPLKQESEIEIYAKMIYNKLIDHEVDERYANLIVDEIDRNVKTEGSLDYVISSVYQKMILKLGEPKPIRLTEKKPKVVFFIGPTGVGKTTTIAKIASKFALEDKCKIAMLTADTYRIAATEQLNTYANILNVPFKVVYTPEEIQSAVEEYADFDLILIDTAGHSHQNAQQLSDIKKLTDSIPEGEQKEIFLVLSATTKYKDLLRIADTYKEIPGYKLIFTKLDETTYYGNILNLKLYTDAELSYLTCGQNVPDDIEKLDAQKVVKQLLGGN